MHTTVVGVLGEQLPHHPDWEIDESDEESCRWIMTRDSECDASIVLLFHEEDWSTSVRTAMPRVENGVEIMSYKFTVIDDKPLLDILETINTWMDSPPKPDSE